jgi:hypothetical protein
VQIRKITNNDNNEKEKSMKNLLLTAGLITSLSIMFGAFSPATAETLKQYSTVCQTKAQFNEIVDNREDKAYVMRMLADGKCIMNVTGAMPAKVLEGLFPMVKIKVKWGDKTFIGWTDSNFITN